MAKIITSLNAQSYEGQFSSTTDGFTVEGTLAANAQKSLTNIYGSVSQSEGTRVLSFSAYRGAEGFIYSFNDVRSVNDLPAAVAVISSVVAAVEAELAEA